MATAAFLLMCFATGCFIAYGMAKKDGNVKFQIVWGLLGMLAVGLALVLWGFIALRLS
jgi:hypothetical protein